MGKNDILLEKALDRTYFLIESWDKQIIQLDIIKNIPKLKEKADKIIELMSEFYQDVGSID